MHIILSPLSQVSADQIFTLGEIGEDENGNKYIYLQGIGSTAVGSWVNYDPKTFTTKLADKTETDKLYPLAVAMGATVANKYGWYQIFGKATAKVAASSAIEVPVYVNASAGLVTDAATSGSIVQRAVLLVAVGSGGDANTSVWIEYPGLQ